MVAQRTSRSARIKYLLSLDESDVGREGLLVDSKKRELLQKHIKTHTVRSSDDRAAVSTLEYFLRSDGRVNTSFASDDKWPNHDGTFEFVSNQNDTRRPRRVFKVQIKGTRIYIENNDTISYVLKSLAFPAFIANEVTSDPGILFIVLNPTERGKERVFWKYMSPSFINSINFEKNSKTIKLTVFDEIVNTEEGIDEFCERIEHIIDRHLFLERLDRECLDIIEAKRIISYRCSEISKEIEYISDNTGARDESSLRIIRNGLYDLCYATLILNAFHSGYEYVNERLAWEVSELSFKSKFLSEFLKGLKYIGRKIPAKGQSERLMLKYYNYLWNIRALLKDLFSLNVLENLDQFPLDLDRIDKDYYEMIAASIEATHLSSYGLRNSRYYIQNTTPFFVHGKRYYEITLQLAGLYATKYNRITVYSRENIPSNYSIQIAYIEKEMNIWGANSRLKILTNWKVSISPSCLNKIGKILQRETRISSRHGEYEALMSFLTCSGMNLLEIINLQEDTFRCVYESIYSSAKTCIFGEILKTLRREFSYSSPCRDGIVTIRYLLLDMREETIGNLLPNAYNGKRLCGDLNLTSRCLPFERNPFVSNLYGKYTERNLKSLCEAVNDAQKAAIALPYIRIRELTLQTGELYHKISDVAEKNDIVKYNSGLNNWERNTGHYAIKFYDEMVVIDSYEKETIYILKKLSEFANAAGIVGQSTYNKKYLATHGDAIDDPIKRFAITTAFVNSPLLLVYGAAGAGKTTLLKLISDMAQSKNRLFLSKTHTALQALKRCVGEADADYKTIDSVSRSNASLNYDIVFIDECSTIDNRAMAGFLKKLGEGTMIVLSGDIYQIEPIRFGNWFYYAKEIDSLKASRVDLTHNWRTDKEELRSLWDEVRVRGALITEKLSMAGPFSEELGGSILDSSEDDEVVLCLNYDGKFGLNSINQYFQNANVQNEAVVWAEWSYKIGDKILFNDTKRFMLLYNNLKGEIVKIDKSDTEIQFTIDVNRRFSMEQCRSDGIEFIKSLGDKTRIKISVIAWDDDLSEEDKKKTTVPFQIAYAISIHKAQGLEYQSVKLIIPSSNAEKITHAIFYTAITRAKEKLKIYWSPETMDVVVKNITNKGVKGETLSILTKRL